MSVLVAWLWQGCLLAVIAAGVLRALPRTSAATRHLVLWGALACVVSLPVLHLAGSGGAAGAAPERAGTATAQLVLDATAPATAIGERPTWTLPAPPDWVISLALGAWLGLVLLSTVAVGRGVRHVHRLARSGEPLPRAREARLTYWASVRGSGRPMRLRISRQVQVPCAVGLGVPTILVPRDLVDAIDDRDLDLLVLHERAHLLRYDDWTRLAEACAVALAGWHPAVRWLSARIDAERESACDDLVLTLTGAPRAYAACLATTAEAVMPVRSRTVPLLAPGAVLSRGLLEHRVRRVMDSRHRPAERASRAAASAGALAFTVLAVLLARTAPMLAFVPQPAARGEQARSVPFDEPTRQADAVPRVEPTPAATSTNAGVRATQAGTPVARTVTEPRAPRPGADTRRADLPSTHSSTVQAAIDPPEPARSPAAVPRQVSDSLQSPVELPSALPIDAGVRLAPVVPAPNATRSVAVPGAERSPWAGMAQAGVDVGSGAKKASQAVAGFFSRAGQAVAGSF